MAITAEITQTEFREQWVLAQSAFPELERRAEIETNRFLGKIALQGEVQVERIEPNNTTLLAEIQLARLGDKRARGMVKKNVATDVAERNYKAGHQTKVSLDIQNNQLMQNGRRLLDVNRNTFENVVLNPEMFKRSKYELKNVFLFGELINAGVLQTHNAVVFEPCPTDQKTKKSYRFFEATDTCSMQLLSVEGSQANLETAFVAGKKTPNSLRHDIAAIYRMAPEKGIEIVVDDTSDMIRYVILVPKTATPNGVCDIVELFDKAAGGTFYGEAKPQQDYALYAEECDRRNQSFEDIVEAITQQLLSEAHAFESPLEAIERLDYLSEWFCVKRAANDTSIDAMVFGARAAAYIEEARFYMQQGDLEGANSAINNARQVADSSSCPMFRGADKQTPGEPGSPNKPEEKSKKKWMKCPHCSAKVYDDPCAKLLICYGCKAMVVNGKVATKGNGGSKKREVERLQQKQEAEMAKRVDEIFAETDLKLPEHQSVSKQAGQMAMAGVQ